MKTEAIVNFFFEVASLRRIVRSHRQFIGGADDNISDHSHRVAIIGFTLAKLEGADADKVLKMCIFHDLVEARTGDANFLHRQYVEQKEQEARQDQLRDLPMAEEIKKILDEYEERKSKESKVAKDADLLDQVLVQQEYFYHDKENKKIWQNHIIDRLLTKTAKDLAKKIEATNPFEWHYQASEKKTGKKINR